MWYVLNKYNQVARIHVYITWKNILHETNIWVF